MKWGSGSEVLKTVEDFDKINKKNVNLALYHEYIRFEMLFSKAFVPSNE